MDRTRTVLVQQALDEQPLARPYPPSWVDRLTNWVRGLRLPGWLVYLALGMPVFALFTLICWYDGAYPVGTYFPLHFLYALTGFYHLALIHYLDNLTSRSVDEFRPVLVLHDRSYDDIEYRFTTMPAGRAVLWSLVGSLVICAYLVYLLVLDREQAQAWLLFTSPQATVFEFVVGFGMGLASGASIYHAVRQLSMIDHIYTRHTDIDLFKLDPLHAFSRLAAWTALSFALLTHVWVVFWPGALSNAVSLALLIGFAAVATMMFLLPLLGIHRLLMKEKERRKTEAGEQLNLAVSELHQRNTARDYAQMDALNHTTEALVRERDVLEKIPMWPWQPDTVRWLGTALLLPIVVWLITRVLERLGF